VSYVKSIPVTDARGDEVTIHEFHDRRFLKKVRRLKLDTGELVEERSDGFLVVGTGERLIPVST
jgi:hypothetical protein